MKYTQNVRRAGFVGSIFAVFRRTGRRRFLRLGAEQFHYRSEFVLRLRFLTHAPPLWRRSYGSPRLIPRCRIAALGYRSLILARALFSMLPDQYLPLACLLAT